MLNDLGEPQLRQFEWVHQSPLAIPQSETQVDYQNWTYAHACNEIAATTNLAAFILVIAKLRMVQRQFHEPRERHRATGTDFGTDNLQEWVRSLRHGVYSD